MVCLLDSGEKKKKTGQTWTDISNQEKLTFGASLEVNGKQNL
jgi:hypothetical protein